MKTVARQLKLLMMSLLGRELIWDADPVFPKERFGSDYGGYELITTGLNADSIVYSFGVGSNGRRPKI